MAKNSHHVGIFSSTRFEDSLQLTNCRVVAQTPPSSRDRKGKYLIKFPPRREFSGRKCSSRKQTLDRINRTVFRQNATSTCSIFQLDNPTAKVRTSIIEKFSFRLLFFKIVPIFYRSIRDDEVLK